MKYFLLFVTLSFAHLSLATIHEVSVTNNVFTPSSLIIEAGDTVRWTNNSDGEHNVYAVNNEFRCSQGCDSNGGNGSPSNAAWSFEITFRSLGTINYVCEPHAFVGMEGSITVIEPQSATIHPIEVTTDNLFSPDDITLLRGDIVNFTNSGGLHNIASDDYSLICSQSCNGDGFNTTSAPTGFPFSIYLKFNQIQEIPYFCETHLNTGIIRVITDTFFANGFE